VRSWRHWYWLVLGCALTAGAAPADEPIVIVEEVPAGPAQAEEHLTSLKQLQRLNQHQLEQLFAAAEAPSIPVGFNRGQVLMLTGRAFPRTGAWVAGLVWKGKHFDEDGHFINQWLGFRALQSQAGLAPSWYDGRPCLVMQYPPGTPLFGNMRDEFREVGPGLYLGRAYERSPEPRFRGYIGMQCDAKKDRRTH
jgi:hypothetical protein